MIAEIITVGTELLLGQIVNTNAAFLSKELASLGIEVYHQITVGDNDERIKDTLEVATRRADIVILTGGLGPTKDDRTKMVLSNFLNIPLVLDRETEDKIISFHEESGLTMPENNQLQALVIEGSSILKNKTGMAVGMFIELNDITYVVLPGPPSELEPMFGEEVMPKLIERTLNQDIFKSKTLRFFGLTEAKLAEELDELIEKQTNPTIAIYAHEGDLSVRITANGSTNIQCDQFIDGIVKEIVYLVGDFHFGYGDKSLSEVVKDLLIENKLTITAAESLTGGAFLSSITQGSGASSICEGGMVTYSERTKKEMLGIDKKTIEDFGVVSSECAIEMAEKIKDKYDAKIGVSLTGVAGPGLLENKDIGTVWVGIAFDEKTPFAKEFHFPYQRSKNRNRSVLNALELIRRLILNLEIVDIIEKTEK
ncbi:competence/damage-inducible protein A [Lacticigenium naphthae]|uniref:competence/damage-inducible protein A n=1 Tax=Lacticigenium naphthae TaxID=515351 RepID=UPI000403A8EC|nr:competence/damage-inducible protein A [Lacticigenium naphthae]